MEGLYLSIFTVLKIKNDSFVEDLLLTHENITILNPLDVNINIVHNNPI